MKFEVFKMTKKELSQFYYLKKEIKEQQKRLEELETLATARTAKITKRV